MSVLIKGMDGIPDHGTVLVVVHADDGRNYIKPFGFFGCSMELVKLPEKHGRLIDANALCKDLTRFYKNEVTARSLIYEQPVVIEAEGET